MCPSDKLGKRDVLMFFNSKNWGKTGKDRRVFYVLNGMKWGNAYHGLFLCS